MKKLFKVRFAFWALRANGKGDAIRLAIERIKSMGIEDFVLDAEEVQAKDRSILSRIIFG